MENISLHELTGVRKLIEIEFITKEEANDASSLYEKLVNFINIRFYGEKYLLDGFKTFKDKIESNYCKDGSIEKLVFLDILCKYVYIIIKSNSRQYIGFGEEIEENLYTEKIHNYIYIKIGDSEWASNFYYRVKTKDDDPITLNQLIDLLCRKYMKELYPEYSDHISVNPNYSYIIEELDYDYFGEDAEINYYDRYGRVDTKYMDAKKHLKFDVVKALNDPSCIRLIVIEEIERIIAPIMDRDVSRIREILVTMSEDEIRELKNSQAYINKNEYNYADVHCKSRIKIEDYPLDEIFLDHPTRVFTTYAPSIKDESGIITPQINYSTYDAIIKSTNLNDRTYDNVEYIFDSDNYVEFLNTKEKMYDELILSRQSGTDLSLFNEEFITQHKRVIAKILWLEFNKAVKRTREYYK